jgi:hypothetical protein
MTRPTTRPPDHPLAKYVDCPVDVHFGPEVLPGKMTRVVKHMDGKDIKVIFDDPLVFGGVGTGWFTVDQVALPGQAPPLR